MLSKGDFHIHSNSSDGDLSPKEIIISAKERGIDIIAITDHNTTAGIKEGIEAGKEYDISVVPAVEVSTRYNDEKVHILGYFRDNQYNDSAFQEILKLIKSHKAKKVRDILINFKTIGASKDHLSVLEGICLLRTFGAAVVLAHPARINQKYLSEIFDLPFDGIEAKCCSNGYLDTPYFIDTALSRFSFYTAGSDFHTNKRGNAKHCLIGEPYLNQSEIEMFLKKSGALLLN